MLALLLHTLPVVFALASFWCNTERKLLLLNLGLCISISSLLLFEQAWGGAIVLLVAGMSTTYRLVKQTLLSATATYVSLSLMTGIVLIVNDYTGQTSVLAMLPVFTFMAYRFGELYCKEAGLRVCMIVGSANFTLYAMLTQTWGLAITEAMFAISNTWYWFKLRRQLMAHPA
ncbi:YgjV family protein [Aestuariibacter sp. A3R04]|uniref:YgjV family protein n=1 Tax=Aestuariibacter sp. A3R04 TaxID=2841571 RepID=UPI001C0940D4|nr:YgjV family protein [Aestuariibacter sp. A3R04]MBU3021704.1 YgjV family protein [Aestuariibacter sp. A3R04]